MSTGLIVLCAWVAWFALALAPWTRAAALMPILWVAGPIFLLRKYRAPAEPEFSFVADAERPPGGAIASHARALAGLGFEERGVWSAPGALQNVRVFAAVFEHREIPALAIVWVSRRGATSASSEIELATPLEGATLRTVHFQTPRRGVAPPDHDVAELPRLADFAALLEVHRARLARADHGAAGPLPAREEMPGWLAGLLRAAYEAEVDSGRLRRSAKGRCYRVTVKGAIVGSWTGTWPGNTRVRAAACRREEETLRALGLTELLNRAGAAPIAEPSAVLTPLPDDRGTPRTIVRGSAVREDERRGDPRFSALLSLADGARAARYLPAYRGTRVWQVLVSVAIVVACVVFAPNYLWVAIVALPIISFVLRASRGTDVHGAEQVAADVILRRGLCPSCLYSLAELQEESDGCLVCPECGGAWRRSRVQQFLAFRTDAPPSSLAAPLRTFPGRGFQNGTQFKDHRGAACVLVPPGLRAEIALAQGDYRERLDRARCSIRRSGVWVRVPLSMLFLAAILVVAWTFARLPGFARRGAWWFPIPGFLFLFAAIGALRGDFAYSRGAIIRAMLRERLCPSCAADLVGLPADADAKTFCRQCGHAWAVPIPPIPARPATPARPDPAAPAGDRTPAEATTPPA